MEGENFTRKLRAHLKAGGGEGVVVAVRGQALRTAVLLNEKKRDPGVTKLKKKKSHST